MEEEEGNSIVFEEMGITGLVFQHDDRDNEYEEQIYLTDNYSRLVQFHHSSSSIIVITSSS